MAELIDHLGLGFAVALSLENLLYCFIGVLLGTLIGVLPGIGPAATIAMLLPITYKLDPTGALIMLAGIYYGAQYGGSVAAILLKIPGESSSVMTTLDGHALAAQGRAGEALAIAAVGSFIAGTIATTVVAGAAPPFSKLAQAFAPADYAALMLFGLVFASLLAPGSFIKAVAMVALGVLLGLIGTDVITGTRRFTFGIPELADGVGFIPLGMGIFGIAEIGLALSARRREERAGEIAKVSLPWTTLRQSIGAILRGTGVGAVLGVLPGGGAVLSSFAAYFVEKRLARDPSRFGKGAIEGVAAPESANNAGAQTSFIPLLTLGIPTNPVMALMIGAMMIKGISPGPQVMSGEAPLVWGMIASMWIGNLLLLVINLPLVRLWARLVDVPPRFLYPAVVVICCIGAYTVDNAPFDVVLVGVFGVLGFAMARLGFEAMPLVLGFVLGPMMEENLRRALLLSRGDVAVFVERPISLFFVIATAAVVIGALVPIVRRLLSTSR
jgi:putative tricarboxylic transport membrane protein